jgi:hypothetical protein
MRAVVRIMAMIVLAISSLSLTSCGGRVGVGMSVGIPVGNHGFVSVGTGRW